MFTMPAFAFCDPRVAVEAASINRQAAQTAIFNKGITGASLIEVAKKADLTSNTVANFGSLLMRDRTPEDQVAIWEVAQQRSAAAGKYLLGSVGPTAFRLMKERAEQRTIPGSQNIREFRTYYNRHDSIANHIFDPELGAEMDSIMSQALHAVWSARDVEGLKAAAETIAQLSARDTLQLRTQLLDATLGRYEVVEHWTEHGGDAGLLLAASDARTPAEVLLGIADRLADRAAFSKNVQLAVSANVRASENGLDKLKVTGRDLLADPETPDATLAAWARAVFEQHERQGSGVDILGEHCIHLPNLPLVEHLVSTAQVVNKECAKAIANSLAHLVGYPTHITDALKVQLTAWLPELGKPARKVFMEQGISRQLVCAGSEEMLEETVYTHCGNGGATFYRNGTLTIYNEFGFSRLRSPNAAVDFYSTQKTLKIAERIQELTENYTMDGAVPAYAGVFASPIAPL